MQPVTLGRLVVIGQGYVGLPVAMRAAEVGWQVVGFEIDDQRVKRLAAGQSFVEDVAAATLQAALDAGTYTASSDPAALADFDVAVVSVPTPLRAGGAGRPVAAIRGLGLAPVGADRC